MISRKKIWIYDILAILGICIVGFILYTQSVISPIQLFLGIVGIAIALIFIFFIAIIKKNIVLFSKNIFNYTRRVVTKFIIVIQKKCKYYWSLLFRVSLVLHNKYDTRMIETIFTYFVHYYKNNASEISHNRAFPKEEFPKGSYDIIKAYVYISQLRERNQELLSKIDYISSPIFLDMEFKSLKFKINKNYELHIIGNNYDDEMSFLQFTAFRTKIINAITDLDTQIACWLIRNRSHFGF